MISKNQKKVFFIALLATQLVGFSSCGVGKKIVRDLQFKSEASGTTFLTGFDAKIDLPVALPETTLPIYAPKDKSKQIGQFKIEGDILGVRIDLKQALKVDVLDGSLLPNNRPLPVTLSDGIVPIAFPIGGTNSKVYLALGAENLMAGVAVTFKGDKLPDLLKQSANIFFPFTIATNLTGNVGLFSGDAFGLAVFAVKTMGTLEKSALGLTSSRLRKMGSAPEKIQVQETNLSRKQLNKVYNAVGEIEVLELN